MRGVLAMPLDRTSLTKKEALSATEKKRMIWALNQVLKNPDVNTKYRLSKLLNVSNPLIFAWFSGRTPVGPQYVKLLVKLGLGKVTESDLRPDIFYDVKE